MAERNTEYPQTRLSLLVQLKSEDDNEAWQQFVTIYRPIIYRMARKRGIQDADAEDLAQQIMFSMSQSISRWEKRDEKIRFRHWLRRVAKNAILNALTRHPKDRAVGGSSVDNHGLNNQAEQNEQLEREVYLEHRREIFFNASLILKDEVSADAQKVFQLSIVDGVPIQEVAQTINKSIGATYAIRGRLMNRLKSIVSELEQEE